VSGKSTFFHALVGRNTEPLTKLADFERRLDALEARQNIDVAMVKFCFVDFSKATDVEVLFRAYSAEVEKLQARYPKTTFVHITAPLTVVQGGIGGWLKSHFGSGAWGEKENAKRHAFNALLRSTFKDEPVFDLATLESTLPDGSIDTYQVNGASVPRLRGDLTDDGGHLNGRGCKMVADELLRFLAALPIKTE